MAQKRNERVIDGERWYSVSRAASVLRTTNTKVIQRAFTGEFEFMTNSVGMPIWIRAKEIVATQSASQNVATAKPSTQSEKTAAQLEREWARMSERNKMRVSSGPVTSHAQKVARLSKTD